MSSSWWGSDGSLKIDGRESKIEEELGEEVEGEWWSEIAGVEGDFFDVLCVLVVRMKLPH